MAKIPCDTTQYGPAISKLQAALLKTQADAWPDCAEGLEGECLGVVQADEGRHHLLELHLCPLPQDQPLLLQPCTQPQLSSLFFMRIGGKGML